MTWKFATTLDGRSAAADGTSRWVSGRAARLDTHRLRALCDVMLVGTNTVAVDDPQLTVRDEHDQPLPEQPLRVVMGERDLPVDQADLRRPGRDASTCAPATRATALETLFERDRQHVFLEGGPTLAAAFLRAGLVDEIVAYVAPMLLGAGQQAVADLGITTIADAFRPVVTDVTVLDGARRRAAQRAAHHDAPRRRPLMFTGIVEELGTVAGVEDQGDAIRLTIHAEHVLADAGLGDSISVNGCCLTVAAARRRHLDRRRHAGDARQDQPGRRRSPATGSTSSARSPRPPGSAATSCRATSTASAPSYGRARRASTGRSSTCRCRPSSARYLVDKGSITVDGVSLTVVEARDDGFTVSLIPETLARTTLGSRQPGDRVNLEVDVLAKHVEKLLAAQAATGRTAS